MKNFSFCWPQLGHAFSFSFSCKIILVVLSGMMGPGAITGQTLNINNEGSNSATFDLDQLPWELIQPAPTEVPPFYWIFTIYDNGEYSPVMYKTKPSPNGVGTVEKYCWENYPHETIKSVEEAPFDWAIVPTGVRRPDTSFTYAYPLAPAPVAYNPISFIIARKGDPPPPPPETTARMALPSGVSIDNFAQEGSRAKTIPDGESIYLAHSHGYLQNGIGHNQSAFIVSYKPNSNHGGRVHLFYGCKRDGPAGNLSSSAHLSSDASINNIHRFPNYYLEDNQGYQFGNGALHPMFERQKRFNFSADFESKVRDVIGVDGEFRFFEFVGYNNEFNQLETYDWSFALAVLTTEDKEYVGNLESQQRLFLRNLLGSDVYNPSSNTLYTQNVVGFDTIFLKSGEPIDPNNITITKVCDDKRTVFLNLKFCNLAKAGFAASSSTIDFDIIDPNFVWCGLADIQHSIKYPMGRSIEPGTKCKYCRKNPIKNHARYFCQNDSISITKKLDPGKCATISVVLKLKEGANQPSEDNLLEYLEKHRILRASVTLLPNTTPLVVRNELLPKYYKPEDCLRRSPCTPCKCSRFLPDDQKRH